MTNPTGLSSLTSIQGKMFWLSQKPLQQSCYSTLQKGSNNIPYTYIQVVRCCQFQTPPTTVQNLDFFSPRATSRKSAKLCTRNLGYAICPQNLAQFCAVSMHMLKMRARVSCNICPTEFSCKQLCWFPECQWRNSYMGSGWANPRAPWLRGHPNLRITALSKLGCA